LTYVNRQRRSSAIMAVVRKPRNSRCACWHGKARSTRMKHESASDDLPAGNPLSDPGVRKLVADLAKSTQSEEDAVRVLFVDAYDMLNREARIFGFVPLLAAKRVRRILTEHAHHHAR
jgi:hypothetical protein